MTVYLGETIWIKAVTTEKDGTVLSPSSHVVTLHDPSGTTKDTDLAPSGSLGTYYAQLDVPSDSSKGLWKIKWKYIANAVPTLEELEVYVNDIVGG